MKLIVGLGNPGLRYKDTWHNVGYKVAERLARELGLRFSEKKYRSLFGKMTLGGESVIIAKPLTYMNLSGAATAALVESGKIALRDILVICDDANLALGELRIRAKGSAGGHNGLRSIIERLCSENFARLRIGIGPKPQDVILTDYVLSKIGKSQAKVIEAAIDEAAAASRLWATRGIEYAMKEINAPRQKPYSGRVKGVEG